MFFRKVRSTALDIATVLSDMRDEDLNGSQRAEYMHMILQEACDARENEAAVRRGNDTECDIQQSLPQGIKKTCTIYGREKVVLVFVFVFSCLSVCPVFSFKILIVNKGCLYVCLCNGY